MDLHIVGRVLGTVDSCLLAGLEVRRVHVEGDVGRGNDPHFHLVGLAPAELRKEGAGLKLPISR